MKVLAYMFLRVYTIFFTSILAMISVIVAVLITIVGLIYKIFNHDPRWNVRVIAENKRLSSAKKNSFILFLIRNKLLLEICHDLTWIKLNLNQQLTMEHRALLAQIFDSSIEIINGYIVDKDSSYLDIVIKSLKTIAEPYQDH